MNKKRTGSLIEEARLAEYFKQSADFAASRVKRRPKPKYDAAKRTRELIDAIEATSIAARWQRAEPITLELVMERIAAGDHALALSALRALRHVGVLRDEEQNDGSLIYRLAEQGD